MKKLALLACGFAVLVGATDALAANVSVGHSGWFWGNPQPQGNQLNAIDFAGGSGFAAGNFGTLLKTTDGGVSWAGISTGITDDLQQVRVLDPSTVFVGAGCLLRRSTDGGMTFSRIPLPSCSSGTSLTSFSFTDANNGFLLLSNGTVEQTANGGQSFALKTAVPGTAVTGASSPPPPEVILFLTPTNGFATAGGTIFHTTDGGNTWSPVFTGSQLLNDLYFSDGNTGYAVGNGKAVEKTTDGGAHWTAETIDPSFPAADLNHIRCAPGSSALCVATSHQGDQILRTDDGGTMWTSKTASTQKIFALAFNTASNAVGVGQGGATVVSLDGANSFTQVGSSPLSGSRFIRLRANGTSLVTAIGNAGTLARSTDGGHSWTKVGVATTQNVLDAWFPNSAVGFALDTSGALFTSKDGGATWSPLDTGGIAAPHVLYAPDPSTILLIGPRGVVLSTNSGGDFAPTGGKVTQKAFLSDYDTAPSGQLFVYGSKALLESSNKGATFKALPRPEGKRGALDKVDFVSGSVGYALMLDGKLFVTRNAGKKWTELPATGTTGIADMAWGSARDGYLAIGGGTVLRTSDGGKSWRPQIVSPADIDALVATGAQTAFGLSNGNFLFATESGGDQGAPSTLTIKTNVSKVPKKGAQVTISGKLSPALANEQVEVWIRSVKGNSWHGLVPKPTSGAGTFTVKTRIRSPSYIVARWTGDSATNGDGSNLITIGRK